MPLQHFQRFDLSKATDYFATILLQRSEAKNTPKNVRLNFQGSNAQPAGHESDTLTTEPTGREKLSVGLAYILYIYLEQVKLPLSLACIFVPQHRGLHSFCPVYLFACLSVFLSVCLQKKLWN